MAANVQEFKELTQQLAQQADRLARSASERGDICR
jgi:hypothetical protein